MGRGGAVRRDVRGLRRGLVTPSSDHWLTVFSAAVQAVTLAMVFVVQHTQERDQAVTQRRLDEVLRALPRADDRIVYLEDASDEELDDTADRHRAHRPG